MRKRFLLPSVLILAVLLIAACRRDDSTPTPTAVPTPTAEPTATSTPAITPTPTLDSSLTAQVGDLVSVHYTGSLDDGQVFDSSIGGQPISFILGAGQVIRGFDIAIRGLAIGETVIVRLEPEEAYGLHREDLVATIPLEVAPIVVNRREENVGLESYVIGERVTLADGRPGVIVEVTDEIVVVDANHPLAGQALNFEIELVSIE
ncbi:MAG: peptidylprolyl isomerase [Dehalococcoidia bacterium]